MVKRGTKRDPKREETRAMRSSMSMEKQDVIAALSALAQETRLDVFRALVRAGNVGCVPGALSTSLDIPSATLSFHLKELKNARLVSAERNGRSLVYRADYSAMSDLLAYLTENCCESGGCAPSR
jgi:ArsR family transcriptional regulator